MSPENRDPILGGRLSAIDAPAIGGFAGLKMRLLQSPSACERREALPGVIEYGEKGLALAVTVLEQDTCLEVRQRAWELLAIYAGAMLEADLSERLPLRAVGGRRGLILRYERGENLAFADLRKENLCRMNLSFACLQYADLSGADLGRSVNLKQADLRGARLVETNLRGIYAREARLNKANLRGADLQGANLGCADLRAARLEGTNLRRARLEGADLREVCLEGADLRGASLSGTRLEGARLRGASLLGADLRCTAIEGVGWEEVDLRGAIFPDGSRVKPDSW
ncbi:pentapeptide repeat-containing protein [Gloeobacter kilaueensis]|uniref:Pentapeptide repeat-containing protein n=1 Tax=Gloeobacter kilaueensis (strain ATCC BAA-2537 / CCAP 1431/1 / ULC 316 / JS1) TaxID=1183438 RepID=U5QGU5_GLOK1|nr:pentapeptide repeat-containing protein [Gloeobacter kilaueensis]AGY58202.1 pentapeptide repeat-containing protein [Gloeobacter kilaueensis JS1]